MDNGGKRWSKQKKYRAMHSWMRLLEYQESFSAVSKQKGFLHRTKYHDKNNLKMKRWKTEMNFFRSRNMVNISAHFCRQVPVRKDHNSLFTDCGLRGAGLKGRIWKTLGKKTALYWVIKIHWTKKNPKTLRFSQNPFFIQIIRLWKMNCTSESSWGVNEMQEDGEMTVHSGKSRLWRKLQCSAHLPSVYHSDRYVFRSIFCFSLLEFVQSLRYSVFPGTGNPGRGQIKMSYKVLHAHAVKWVEI